MKKLLSVTIIILLSLTGCGGQPSASAGAAPEELPLAVDLTIPAVFFEGSAGESIMSVRGLKAGDDLEEYIEGNGFLDAHWNDDGSLTVTMSIPRFESFKKDMVDNTNRALNDLVEDDEYPFVLGFEATEEFQTTTIIVDRAAFENGGTPAAFLPIYVGVTIGMYRGFVGEDEFYSVMIVDSVTGDRIGGIDFPIEEN